MTSLFFDIGVYLIVVGMMLDIVRSLGTGIDRQIAEERPTRTRGTTTAAGRGGRPAA